MQKLYFLWMVALLLNPFASMAQAPAARLNGQWRGPLKVPGGSLTLSFTIVPLSNGTYYGALDVPQQRISHMPVEVATKDGRITLSIEQAGSRFTGKVLAGGARLEGIWKQPGLSTPVVLKRSAAPTATALASRSTRLTPPYRESEVTFPNPKGGFRLAGTLTVPAGEGPFPAVVLLSDAGPHDRDASLPGYRFFEIMADYLTRRGIAVLRFDDRGVGKSGGEYPCATTADFVTDAQAALAFLRTRPLIAASQVGLLGHGEGANVALLAATDPTADPAFVVSVAGYGQPGAEVLRRQQGELMRLTGADDAQIKAAQAMYSHIVETIRQTPDPAAASTKVSAILRSNHTALTEQMARARAAELTSPWSRFFLNFDPTAHLAEVRCPVLLLNGTADLQVAISYDMALLQKGLRRSGHGVDTRKLAGVNHWFQSDPATWPVVAGERRVACSPQGLDHIRGWVQALPKPPATPLPANDLPVMAERPTAKSKVAKGS